MQIDNILAQYSYSGAKPPLSSHRKFNTKINVNIWLIDMNEDSILLSISDWYHFIISIYLYNLMLWNTI